MKYDLTKPPTRGAQRTLDDFRRRMLRLLSEKAFEEISVNEICEGAHYPRATFYNYFDDKYDLLNYCWIWLATQIRLEEYPKMDPSEMIYVFFDRAYDFTKKNEMMIMQVLSRNVETGMMFGDFRNFMIRQVQKIFGEVVKEDSPIPREIIAEHLSNTLILVWQWCNIGNKECTKEQARVYLRLLLGNLKLQERR